MSRAIITLHRVLVASLGALALTACGGTVRVGALVPVAPELPVRVFPQLAVVHGTAPDDLEVADAIAAHLRASGTGTRVEHLDEDALEARRARGSFGPASAVLQVGTRVLETTRASFVTRPETVCTAYGCQTYRRTMVQDLPVVVGVLVLRVSEGRSGRLLQELRLQEREEGSDALAMRLRVLQRLRQRALTTIDPGERQVHVELLDVGDPEVRAAIDAIQAGHAHEGRVALERVVARPGFASRSSQQRARVLFDLGQARRLESRGGPIEAEEERLETAEETIRSALRVHPEAVFAQALEQIAEERTARARLRAQAEAASHNFALDRQPTMPEPPPGYREAAPGGVLALEVPYGTAPSANTEGTRAGEPILEPVASDE